MGLFDSFRKAEPVKVKRKYTRKQDGVQKSMSPVGDAITSIIQKTGFNIQPFDYEKAETTLENIAKYNPWVGASIRSIVRNSIQPMFKEYDLTSNEDMITPEAAKLIQNPHPNFNWSKFLKFNVFYNIFYGVSYNYKIRSGGKIIALQPIPSNYVRLDQASVISGNIQYFITTGKGQETVKAEDLIIWNDFEFVTGYYTGTSRLKHLLFSIINKNNADRYNKASFENGGEIKGVLSSEQKLGDDDVKIVQSQLKERYGGADNAGKTMVLGSGLTYGRTGQTNQEMGFEQLQKVSREEVIALYKVPPVELGLTESVNYANAKEQRRVFWETMEIPLLESFANVLTEEILQKEFNANSAFYFDFSSIPSMQQDLNVKLQSALLMQSMGYDNETVTRYLDLPALSNVTETPPIISVPEPAKSFNIKTDAVIIAYRDMMKGSFLANHMQNEAVFRDRLEKYFFKQRNHVLDFIKEKYGMKSNNDISGEIRAFFISNKAKWDSELTKMASGFFSNVNQTTVKNMLDKYGLKFFEGIKSTLKINGHASKIKDINETVNKQLFQNLKTAYETGVQEGNSVQEIAQRIIDETKQTYKMAEKRAVTIARTETTSAANDLFLGNFEENGVNQKEWLTSQDENVRSIANKAEFDHAAMDGMTVNIDDQFNVPSTGGIEGMDYPGDMEKGSAGDVINCRCTILPK